MQPIVFYHLEDKAHDIGVAVFKSTSSNIDFEFSIVGCGRNRGVIDSNGCLASFMHDNPMNEDMLSHLVALCDLAKEIHELKEDLVICNCSRTKNS